MPDKKRKEQLVENGMLLFSHKTVPIGASAASLSTGMSAIVVAGIEVGLQLMPSYAAHAPLTKKHPIATSLAPMRETRPPCHFMTPPCNKTGLAHALRLHARESTHVNGRSSA